ncbi:MAG: hypothetical protein AB7E47_10925 [Desulfovibrionaceae bacterium]
MKYLPLILSALLHVGTTTFLIYGPPILHLGARPPEIYEVFIVEPRSVAPLPKPESAPHVEPTPKAEPKPKKQPPVQTKKKTKATSRQQAARKPSPAETLAPPQRREPAPPLPPAPVVAPGVAAISHVKTSMAPANATTPPAKPKYSASFTYDENTMYLGNDVILQDGKPHRDTLKQGSELRFALRRLAHDAFSREDFAGYYTVGDSRFVSILDLREIFGDYVLYDSRTGLFRLLHKTGEMIYAYGPAFADEEPVEGSVTFFPVKHKEMYQDSEKPGHLMWLPKEPMMQWGTRIRLQEETVEVGGAKQLLVRPPTDASLPAVVWICDRGVPLPLVRAFAHALAVRGVMVLAVVPGKIPRDGARSQASSAELAADALSALRLLADRADVDTAKLGIVGVDEAGGAVVEALARMTAPAAAFGVVLNTRVDSVGSLAPPPWPHADAVRVPLLVACVTAKPTVHWQGQLEALQGMQNLRGSSINIQLLPDAATGAIQLTGPELSRLQWVPSLSPRYAADIATWIGSR